MDFFKREIVSEYTWTDLNCRKAVKHTKQRNKLEKELKRRARRRLKQKLRKEGNSNEQRSRNTNN